MHPFHFLNFQFLNSFKDDFQGEFFAIRFTTFKEQRNSTLISSAQKVGLELFCSGQIQVTQTASAVDFYVKD